MALSIPQRFGLLCAAAYIALSWSVRVDTPGGRQNASLVYPLDTFSMYSELPDAAQTALLLRDRRGGIHRVEDFSAFTCDANLRGPYPACATSLGRRHKTEEQFRRMQRGRTADAAGEPVELIARTWSLAPGTPPRFSHDCRIAQCTVRR